MNTATKFSTKKRLRSFVFACNGIKNLVKNEHNAQLHLIALFAAVVLGVLFNISPTEWIAIIMVSGMVIIAEILNTAIEKLSDFVEPKWNEKIGMIKDYGAAAVLISAIVSLIVGGIIFIPRVWDWIIGS